MPSFGTVFDTQTHFSLYKNMLSFNTQYQLLHSVFHLTCLAQNTHIFCLFTHDHPVTPRTRQEAYLGRQLWARGAISSDLLCSLRTF